MYSKLFLLLLVVLFLLFSAISSQAEVCFTDEEAEELDNILLTLETTVTQQETLLKKQEISINNSKQEIELLKISLKEAEISWRKQSIEQIIIAGSAGIGIGMLLLIVLEAIFDPPVIVQ